MVRKKKNEQVEGQIALAMCIDSRNLVVQANKMITGKQKLSLNAAKLIRAAVMQIKPGDENLSPYLITIPQLAELLNIPSQNLYRDAESIVREIMKNPVCIHSDENNRWIMYPWISRCEYVSGTGLLIQLNKELKPFLLALKEKYTQYALGDVLVMKSVYSIRMYELIMSKVMVSMLPERGIDIELTLQEIRNACELGETYTLFQNMRARVLNVAMKEINEKTMYDVSYTYLKDSKKVIGLKIHVNVKYHKGIEPKQ